MNLGERIYCLRTQRNLSQGDLAEALDVSRQSISKWENNSATPELDKLVKLSELFDVSLDELVKGEKTGEKTVEQPPQQVVTIIKKEPMATRKLVGIILLALAGLILVLLTAMGGFLTGLLLAVPLILYGSICLLVSRHTGLCCGWATWLVLNPFLSYCTSLRWTYIFDTFRWNEDWFISRAHILWAWVIFAFMAFMVISTVLAYRKEHITGLGRFRRCMIFGLVLYILLWVVPMPGWKEAPRLYWAVSILRSTLRLPLLAALLTGVARCLYGKKMET